MTSTERRQQAMTEGNQQIQNNSRTGQGESIEKSKTSNQSDANKRKEVGNNLPGLLGPIVQGINNAPANQPTSTKPQRGNIDKPQGATTAKPVKVNTGAISGMLGAPTTQGGKIPGATGSWPNPSGLTTGQTPTLGGVKIPASQPTGGKPPLSGGSQGVGTNVGGLLLPIQPMAPVQPTASVQPTAPAEPPPVEDKSAYGIAGQVASRAGQQAEGAAQAVGVNRAQADILGQQTQQQTQADAYQKELNQQTAEAQQLEAMKRARKDVQAGRDQSLLGSLVGAGAGLLGGLLF